tara:strand:- start:3 stop:566 length:564 start_codon:yes stop_codon:yes gene_type:complete
MMINKTNEVWEDKMELTKEEMKMTVRELMDKKSGEFHALNDNGDGTLKNSNDNSYMVWYRANREELAEMEKAEKLANLKAVKSFAYSKGYTDCSPFEVVRVISAKCVQIRAMDSEQLEWKKDWSMGGFAGHLNNQRDQKWEITSNKDNHSFKIRFSNPKNGYATWKDAHGNKYNMSEAPYKFYDYNF